MDAQLDLLRPDAAVVRALGMPPGLVARRGPEAPARRALAPARASAGGPCLGELLGALSHALDLAEGRPDGHAVRTCWIGQQLGRAIGLNATEMHDLYFATLLKDAGGSANAGRLHELLLADDLAFKRARRAAGTSLGGQLGFAVRHVGTAAGLARRCRAVLQAVQDGGEIHRELTETRASRGAQVARHLQLGDEVAEAIQSLDEHWDGSGQPQGLAGSEIPLLARVALLAQAVDTFHAGAGAQSTRERIARGSGRCFDPVLADAFSALASDRAFWRQLASDDLETRLFETSPVAAKRPVADDTLDDVARVFGQIADAKSAWTTGHSDRVARHADAMGARLGLDDLERRWLRRGALLHDIGRLGVGSRILDKPAPLDSSERAAMQRHALVAEKILARIPSFGALARLVGAHHERLDGSGYPRGLDARHIRLETRILTAANVWDALTSDRPWRAAMPPAEALRLMRDGVGTAVDGDCLAALERSLKEGALSAR